MPQRTILIIAAIFLVLILFSVLNRSKGTKGTSDKDRAVQTQQTMNLIDRGEARWRTQHGGYTSHISDLLEANRDLGQPLESVVNTQIDVSADRKTYIAQVAGTVVGFVRARTSGRLVSDSCTIFKKGSGFSCPSEEQPAPPTVTTTAVTTPTGTTATTP